MKKWLDKGFLITVVVLGISPLVRKIFSTPWWITIFMLLMWWIIVKNQRRYIWFILTILIFVNLYLNRLLSINLSNFEISFDFEQSFVNYPGIRNSIFRYKEEGLWLPYQLRKIFYNDYLLLLPWLTNVSKLLSINFWVKLLGFSGFSLFSLGLFSYFKNRKRNIFIIIWFILIITTSALRVLGDTVTFAYLTIPTVFYFIFCGTKTKIFLNYFYFWLFLFTIDFILI